MPLLECGLRRVCGTTFYTSLSPRRGHTRQDARMRRRVGPQQVAQIELRPSVERTGARNALVSGHTLLRPQEQYFPGAVGSLMRPDSAPAALFALRCGVKLTRHE